MRIRQFFGLREISEGRIVIAAIVNDFPDLNTGFTQRRIQRITLRQLLRLPEIPEGVFCMPPYLLLPAQNHRPPEKRIGALRMDSPHRKDQHNNPNLI